jgi:predicted HAD superfamily Cof-like phosphohydrolase
MTRSVDLVKDFHVAFNCFMIERRVPPVEISALRIQCLIEEVAELAAALCHQRLYDVMDACIDLQYFIDGTYLTWGIEKQELPCNIRNTSIKFHSEFYHLMYIQKMTSSIGKLAHAQLKYDFVTIEDQLRGLEYYVNDVLDACGMLSLKMRAFELVHAANMAKLVDGKPVVDASGRVVKPKDWQPPDWDKFFRE